MLLEAGFGKAIFYEPSGLDAVIKLAKVPCPHYSTMGIAKVSQGINELSDVDFSKVPEHTRQEKDVGCRNPSIRS